MVPLPASGCGLARRLPIDLKGWMGASSRHSFIPFLPSIPGAIVQHRFAMPSFHPYLLLAGLVAAIVSAPSLTPALLGHGGEACAAGLHYPPARTVDVIEDHFGVEVADPYRWMEDPDDPELQPWIAQENELTQEWLAGVAVRDSIRERLTRLWDYPRTSAPFRRGERLFFFRNDGLQNQSVLYVQDEGKGEPRVLLDPNTLSEDGTVALGGMGFSEDGRYLAWSTSDGGSDWRSWRVRDVDTGRDFDDRIEWSKFSGASWTHDDTGFYYSRYDEPAEGEELEQANYNQKLYYHRLGTPQSDDLLVYERPDHKEWGIGGRVSEDGRYLIIDIWKGTDRNNAVFYQDLQGEGEVVELLKDFDASYGFLGNDGGVFYFQTNLDAPRGRVIAIDTARPQREDWKELVAEQEDTLDNVSLIGDLFFAQYMHDAQDIVRRFALDGRELDAVELPGIGSLGGFGARRQDTDFYYTFTSFTEPATIYHYDVASNTSTLYHRSEIDFDPSPYETVQVFCHSKDGTRIPLFITHRKGVELDGTHPCYLYGYGGFNIPMKPRFSTSRVIWLEMGGIYAQACLRGGGEYGEDWHQAGSLANKQNTFDDFIAAAEYLIEKGWTSTPRLAIAGGSNGGLLVGACEVQRPDLFGACLPAVGVLDMLRFDKWTIGWAWRSDYGSPDDPEQFKVLLGYSPYHNIQDGVHYPATFITTADHDDRVFPAHSFKFAARLQAAQGGDAPILIRIQTRAGHGAGKPTAMIIAEEADRWAFLVKALRIGAMGGS